MWTCEICPIAVARWARGDCDGQAIAASLLNGLVREKLPFIIVVGQENERARTQNRLEACEIADAKAGASLLAGQLPIGAGAFKALGNPHDPAVKASRPGAPARIPQHHAMRADGGFGIEKQALDGDEALAHEYAYQQGREKARCASTAHWAPSVKANIRRDKSDPAHISEIPLAKCVFNRPRLSPEAPEWGLAIVGGHRHCTLIRDRMPQNLPNSAHHCGAITAGKAMDEDRVSTLPDREAWRPVLVRRTAHHGVPARPDAAKALNDGKRFGGGLIAHRDLSQEC